MALSFSPQHSDQSRGTLFSTLWGQGNNMLKFHSCTLSDTVLVALNNMLMKNLCRYATPVSRCGVAWGWGWGGSVYILVLYECDWLTALRWSLWSATAGHYSPFSASVALVPGRRRRKRKRRLRVPGSWNLVCRREGRSRNLARVFHEAYYSSKFAHWWRINPTFIFFSTILHVCAYCILSHCKVMYRLLLNIMIVKRMKVNLVNESYEPNMKI